MSLNTEVIRWTSARGGRRGTHNMHVRVDYADGGMSERSLEFSIDELNGEYLVWHKDWDRDRLMHCVGRTRTLKQAKEFAEATYLLGE